MEHRAKMVREKTINSYFQQKRLQENHESATKRNVLRNKETVENNEREVTSNQQKVTRNE